MWTLIELGSKLIFNNFFVNIQGIKKNIVVFECNKFTEHFSLPGFLIQTQSLALILEETVF